MIQTYTFKEIEKKVKDKILVPCNFQRPLDKDRVNIIKDYILEKHYKKTFILGTVIVSRKNGKEYIIDGQHRLLSIAKAIRANPDDESKLSDKELVFNIYENLSYDEDRELFYNINKSKPISKYYISDKKITKFVDTVVESLRKTHSTQFKYTDNPRPPNVGESHIKERLIDDKIVRSLYGNGDIIQARHLINMIEMVNIKMRDKLKSDTGLNLLNKHYSGSTEKNDAYLKSMIKNIEQKVNPFYLGIIPRYEWCEYIIHTERLD